jgi:hypothetical protein
MDKIVAYEIEGEIYPADNFTDKNSILFGQLPKNAKPIYESEITNGDFDSTI